MILFLAQRLQRIDQVAVVTHHVVTHRCHQISHLQAREHPGNYDSAATAIRRLRTSRQKETIKPIIVSGTTKSSMAVL